MHVCCPIGVLTGCVAPGLSVFNKDQMALALLAEVVLGDNFYRGSSNMLPAASSVWDFAVEHDCFLDFKEAKAEGNYITGAHNARVVQWCIGLQCTRLQCIGLQCAGVQCAGLQCFGGVFQCYVALRAARGSAIHP